MVLSPLYGTSKTSYVTIENGKGTAILQTGTIAARDVKLEFQVE